MPRSDEIVDSARVQAALAAMASDITVRPALVQADFTGVRVPDRFVFGFGMDVAGGWRNLPSIRALPAAG